MSPLEIKSGMYITKGFAYLFLFWCSRKTIFTIQLPYQNSIRLIFLVNLHIETTPKHKQKQTKKFKESIFFGEYSQK